LVIVQVICKVSIQLIINIKCINMQIWKLMSRWFGFGMWRST